MSVTLSPREIKNRIKVVENTRKLTHAIEMVSVSKLRPVGTALYSSRVYFERLEVMLKNIVGKEAVAHPLVSPRRAANGKIVIAVVSSDTGLCGAYNNNVLRATEEFLKAYTASQVRVIPVGRKAISYFKKRSYVALQTFADHRGRYSAAMADVLQERLMSEYLSGNVDAAYVAYTRFYSASKTFPVVEKFLNVEAPVGSTPREYFFEPALPALIDAILPEYIAIKLRMVLLNSFAAEHSARVLAMGAATKNAKELWETLILTRNKLRQMLITKEILEIVSSAEALKGGS